MKRKGFTLIELMIGMGIAITLLAILFTVYITTQKLWRGGLTQVTFQSRGRVALEKISRNLRSATGATVLDAGNRIRFVTDPNRTPQTIADDVTSEYYWTGSGLDIMYDPDIRVSGDDAILLRNVYKESTIPFFQASGNLVVITFRVYNSDTVYGTFWSNMSTSVKMRNAL